MVFIYKNISLPNFKPFAVMTVFFFADKLQECKITIKFEHIFSVCNSAFLLLLNSTQRFF
jgi:hypothetical protein